MQGKLPHASCSSDPLLPPPPIRPRWDLQVQCTPQPACCSALGFGQQPGQGFSGNSVTAAAEVTGRGKPALDRGLIPAPQRTIAPWGRTRTGAGRTALGLFLYPGRGLFPAVSLAGAQEEGLSKGRPAQPGQA